MIDENASSSEAVETEEVSAEQFIQRMSDTERDHWLKTGDTPEVKPKTVPPKGQESAPAKEAPGAAKAAETQSDSDTDASGKRDESEELSDEEFKRLGAKAQRRIRNLLAKNKELETKRADPAPAARTEVANPPKEKPAVEAKPEFKETRPKPRLDDKKPDGTPKYASYDELNEDLVDWKLEQRDAKTAFDKAESDKAARATETERKNAEIRDTQRKRVEAVRKRIPKFDEALNDADFVKKIPERSALDGMILSREKGFDVFFHLWEHPQELDAILKLGPHDQAFEFARIELSLEKAPAKKVSNAPPPPREVGGRGTPPEDEVEAAAAAGDVTRYIDLVNRRELGAKA